MTIGTVKISSIPEPETPVVGKPTLRHAFAEDNPGWTTEELTRFFQ